MFVFVFMSVFWVCVFVVCVYVLGVYVRVVCFSGCV